MFLVKILESFQLKYFHFSYHATSHV